MNRIFMSILMLSCIISIPTDRILYTGMLIEYLLIKKACYLSRITHNPNIVTFFNICQGVRKIIIDLCSPTQTGKVPVGLNQGN